MGLLFYKIFFNLRKIIKLILISFVVFTYANKKIFNEKEDVKIALCTMGRNENLYIKEFIEYYNKIGVDHIFIYDDNDPDKEPINQSIDEKYKTKVTVFNSRQNHIENQSDAFSLCYKNNFNKFDWFLMIDMDEFLYIVGDTLKGYLRKKRFSKCDFIKIHWVLPTDNELIHYESKPLFERFRPPYISSVFIKSIIKGNISDLKYWVHSPYISPKRNITCNNIGKIIYYKDMNFESIIPINIKKAYIIHFMFKSTEEFINKLKRGYRNWLGELTKQNLINKLKMYFMINNITIQKIKYIEKELNLNLSEFIDNIDKYSK